MCSTPKAQQPSSLKRPHRFNAPLSADIMSRFTRVANAADKRRQRKSVAARQSAQQARADDAPLRLSEQRLQQELSLPQRVAQIVHRLQGLWSLYSQQRHQHGRPRV